MITSLLVVSSDCLDPYRNLALEEYLLGKVAPNTCILYLWQNERTVVIGRNQSALEECKLQALAKDGGHLARRLSGGGAVYHDLGNQNFTFLLPSADFDKAKQTEVLCQAMRQLGLDAQVSGRNDLTIEGRKFSGHAYYHSRKALGASQLKCSYHHGTIMVNVDDAALGNYLNVNPLKLKAKGVKSVKSRVANLTDFRPSTTCEEVRTAVTQAFSQVYGLTVKPLVLDVADKAKLSRLVARYESQEWLLRDEAPLDNSASGRFDWGTSRLDWSESKVTAETKASQGTKEEGVAKAETKSGHANEPKSKYTTEPEGGHATDKIRAITAAALWSDGLDADQLEEIPAKLVGIELDAPGLAERIAAAGIPDELAYDLAKLLRPTNN